MSGTDRPSLRGLWVASGILVASIAVAGAWMAWAFVTVDARVADFPRAQVPGALQVEVRQPGSDLLVYEEDSPWPEVTYSVTGPDGAAVDLEVYGGGGSFIYTHEGDDGRAVHTFRAARAGTYTVVADQSASPDPDGASFAVAPSIGRRLVLGIVGPMLIAGIGITAGIVLGVVSFVRYLGARSPARPAVL